MLADGSTFANINCMNVSNDIIQKCKNRNPQAQRKVYDMLLPYLNSICRRYLPYSSNRNDVLQETFIKIFTKIDQFDSKRGEFKSWSGKIAINACIQHSQKTITRKEIELSDTEYQIPIGPNIIARLTNAEVLKVLSRMPLEYFQVFNLFVVDGFSHDEIAELLNIKSTLSRKRLARAREWISNRTALKSMIS
ncbi:MAG: sigma-70 family RNA polymerase sigma factor [Bacteroidota bacterium]